MDRCCVDGFDTRNDRVDGFIGKQFELHQRAEGSDGVR